MIQEKILVVEDDIQIQNFMVYTLENAGFEVSAVTGGKYIKFDKIAGWQDIST